MSGRQRSGAKSVFTMAKPYLVIAPALIILAVFWIYPIFNMGYLSLFKWDLISPKMEFVGLDNFKNLFSDAAFWQTLANTLIYTVFVVGLGVGLGLLIALYLHENTKTNGFLQAVVFSPYVVSLASVALLWLWIMNKDFGLLNSILNVFGIGPVDWLGDTNFALPSLIAISVWKSVGYDSLILVSALQGIPKHLYEAARLDHAGKWATFSKITFPMISPTMFFLVIVDVIASLKVFETIQIMTAGGPQNATNTLVYSLYEYGFQFNKVGTAAAIGVVLLVIIAVFSVIYFKLLAKRVHYR
ncbi:MAG: carbohydrate ABC transporter permease [Tractidigestivibacter sp.]|jgi:sn-glycerol 3-phosphate transport system permease protein|uniref:carbohydrate ABC transporter permease n=1 Tax=Tractidigestivibacter sp. TaxID=2847320 RepID=UPI003D930146